MMENIFQELMMGMVNLKTEKEKAALVEKVKSEIAKIEKIKIKQIVEGIKIDFESIQESINILLDCNVEPQEHHYQAFFCKQREAKAPPGMFKQIERDAEKGNPIVKELMDAILEMGTKMKAVMNNFCVSPTVEVNCEKCYFTTICKKKK
jgi:hypothetical protein